MSVKFSRSINSILLYICFFLFTLIVLLPVYWMTRSAFANVNDLYKTPVIYFPPFALKNFQTLLEQVPLLEYTRNSFLFALATTSVTIVVSYLAAYAFARFQFRWSGFLMWTLVLSSALPDIGTIVPLYKLLQSMHLLDTITGITLILSSALVPFTVWALISFIKQIPYEIEEAAIIDGANLPQIFWHILLPVTMPGVVTMGLINFINAWNNLLYLQRFFTLRQTLGIDHDNWRCHDCSNCHSRAVLATFYYSRPGQWRYQIILYSIVTTFQPLVLI
jgi:multiple sugar transport system permease protein